MLEISNGLMKLNVVVLTELYIYDMFRFDLSIMKGFSKRKCESEKILRLKNILKFYREFG